MKIAGRFFRQSLMSYRGLFGWLDPRIYVLVKVINPVFTVIFFCMLARYAYQTQDVTPYIIGNAMILVYINAIFGVGDVLASERYNGTLKIVAAAPANKFFVFVSRGFFHIFDGLLTVFLGLAVGTLVFGIDFQGSIWQLLMVILVSTYSVFGLGLVIASLGLKYRDMNLIMNIGAMMILSLTGANFPVEKLPTWLHSISKVLPLTRGITAARMTSVGEQFAQIQSLLLSELVLGTIFVMLGFAMFSWMDRLAIKDGAFDFY